jgi:hypothetical protein
MGASHMIVFGIVCFTAGFLIGKLQRFKIIEVEVETYEIEPYFIIEKLDNKELGKEQVGTDSVTDRKYYKELE